MVKKDLHLSAEDIGRYVSVIHKGAKYGIGGDQTTTFGIAQWKTLPSVWSRSKRSQEELRTPTTGVSQALGYMGKWFLLFLL